MTLAWSSALIPRSCNPELRNAARSGGVSLSGQEQRVFSPAARWEVTYQFSIHSTTQVNAWRAMLGGLRSGDDIIVTVYDMHKPGNFGGDTTTLASAAALGAATLDIEGSGVVINAGQHISLGGDRLHLVTTVDEGTETNAGLVLAVSGDALWSDADIWIDGLITTIGIVPPTRAAYAEGATVNLSALKLRCVLKDISDGDLGLDLGRFGSPSITFVESIS